ncbi:carboxylesterase [Clostridia bacterium]|nr:carboxylesterase [Clostridia bacterium]
MPNLAVVLIHGFCGSPEELAYLHSRLEACGVRVYSFTLAGHGGTKDELRRSKYADWIHSAEDYLNSLPEEQIALIGFSMGGLIAAYLASDKRVGKIAFINTPIDFWNLEVIFSGIITDISERKLTNLQQYTKSAAKTPLASGVQFIKLRDNSKKRFANVTQEVFIAQCTKDESVWPSSAEFIRSHVSGSAEMKLYEGGCHQVIARDNNCREAVVEDILSFIINKNS